MSQIRVWQSVKVLEGELKDQAGTVTGHRNGKVVVRMDIDEKEYEFEESKILVLGG